MNAFPTPWRPAATSRDEFVENAGKLLYVRGLAGDHPGSPNPNLLALDNRGGLFDKGVCWWHSRLTRAALYLAWFEPCLPRPDEEAARMLISTLMSADRVIAIPGYSCLRDFSSDHRRSVQRQLDRMQLSDGILRFAWIDGLAGSSEVSAVEMKRRMDAIYEETSENGLAYVKLQVPGLDAHSWIVTEMEPVPGGGFRCRHIDSNFPGSWTWEYRFGDQRIDYGNHGRLGVPHLQRSRELLRMKRVIDRFVAQPAAAPEALSGKAR
jgi:hypothetical protein